MRLDQAIAARFPHISRRQARQLLSQHRVLVNERPVSVASREIKATDRVAVVETHPTLNVIASTAEWIAIDKPAGIPVQPGRERTRQSVIELLHVQLKTAGQRHDLFVVHRIDSGTSGLVLFARTRAAAAALSAAFAAAQVQKTYVAVIEGAIEAETRIETPVREKAAVTIVQPFRGSSYGSLVTAGIRTGRTHQIRIHLASIGHPIVGDRRYGSTVNSGRLLLHAWQLEHEITGQLEAPIPSEFV